MFNFIRTIFLEHSCGFHKVAFLQDPSAIGIKMITTGIII